MGAVSESLIAKLDAANLTDDEKLVLALAVSHDVSTEAEVEGFAAIKGFNIGMPPSAKSDAEIEDVFRTRFNQAETLASSFNQAESTASNIRG